MTKITIKDTGYATSDRQGTPVFGSSITTLSTYLVNSGEDITLNVSDMNLQSGTNLSAEPNPASSDAAKISFNTFDNDMYTINFWINARSLTERALLKEIHVLGKTKGIKLLFSSDTSTESKMIPELLGRTDTKFHGNEIAAGIPVIVCKIKGIVFDNKPKSRKYSLTGKLTIQEEQVVKAT